MKILCVAVLFISLNAYSSTQSFNFQSFQKAGRSPTLKTYIVETQNPSDLVEVLATASPKIKYKTTMHSKSSSLLSRFHVIQADPSDVMNLEKDARVISFQENVNYQLQVTSPQRTFVKPGPMSANTDTFRNLQWGLFDSEFSSLDSKSSNVYDQVLIFIGDTWIDSQHADFNPGSVHPVKTFVPPSRYSIHHYHGTHVAGIVSAATNNGRGISGSLSNAEIIPLEVCDPDGCPILSIADAIRYAADADIPGKNHLPRVLNLSLGGPFYSPVIAAAVKYAVSKNVLIVAAAGNSTADTTNFYPAAYPDVLSVGATGFNEDREYQLDMAYFSNYNSKSVGILAPGQDIMSTLPTEYLNIPEAQELLHEGQAFGYLSGTSMASPFITAAAALLRARLPHLSNLEIKELLEKRSPKFTVSGYSQWKNGDYSIVKASRLPRSARQVAMPILTEGVNTIRESVTFSLPEVEVRKYENAIIVRLQMSQCDSTTNQVRWFVTQGFILTTPSSSGYSPFQCGQAREVLIPVALPEEYHLLDQPIFLQAYVEDRDSNGKVVDLTPVSFSSGYDFFNITELLRPQY